MKITKNLINHIEAEAKKHFKKASGCHDWTHTERVRNLALKIGRKEKADLGILELAAFLHDICKCEELKHKGKFCHAERGAKVARKILKKYGVDEETINAVSHCIIAHRTRNDYMPETIEAKILHDADKLDAVGAIGIVRNFMVATLIKTPVLYTGKEKKLARSGACRDYTEDDTAILEYEIKLKHIKDRLFTKEARRIGRVRHEFMEMFLKRFWEEARAEK
jgi:uncharacterized protein